MKSVIFFTLSFMLISFSVKSQDVAGILASPKSSSEIASSTQTLTPAFIKGGSLALARYITDRLHRTGTWSDYNVRGKVQLEIKLDSSGDVMEVFCTKSLHQGLDAQLKHLIKGYDAFAPAIQNGEYTSSTYLLNLLIE